MNKGVMRLGEKLGYVKVHRTMDYELPMAGRDKSSERIPEHMLENIDFGPGCWEWTGNKLPNGYGRVPNQRSPSNYRYAHREMYRLWYWEEVPGGREHHVMHSCDNPGCVRPDHLTLGTARENHDDAVRKGRKAKATNDHAVS
jgi:hypothetical protein